MRVAVLLLAFTIGLAASDAAWAQSACGIGGVNLEESLEQIDLLFRTCTRSWEATLQDYALRLFWLLATIEFAWNAIRLVFRNADVNEWLSELVNQIFFIGFFLALLTHATAWTGAIVASFTEAADGVQRANGFADGSASSIFNIGVTIGTNIWNSVSIAAPIHSIAVLVCAAFIVAFFALMAAAIILAQVEAYVVLSAGVLLMGFGGSRWTKDFALKTVIYAVSVGAKLFLIKLIAGLGAQIIGAWAQLPADWSVAGGLARILIILGSTIVLFVLLKSVPDMIQGLINGTGVGVNTGLVPAIGQLGRGIHALGMAIEGARERVREDRIAGAGSEASAESLLARTGHVIADTARGAAYMPGALREHIGNRLSGRAGKHYRAAQIGRDLRDQARKMEQERVARQKTQAPSAAPPPPSPPPDRLSTGQAANENDPGGAGPGPNRPNTP
jgi:type IV secretion system protein TrbL